MIGSQPVIDRFVSSNQQCERIGSRQRHIPRYLYVVQTYLVYTWVNTRMADGRRQIVDAGTRKQHQPSSEALFRVTLARQASGSPVPHFVSQSGEKFATAEAVGRHSSLAFCHLPSNTQQSDAKRNQVEGHEDPEHPLFRWQHPWSWSTYGSILVLVL